MEEKELERLVAQLEAQAAQVDADDAPGPDEPMHAPAAPVGSASEVRAQYVGQFNAAAWADETAATTALWNVPAEGPITAGGLKGLLQRVIRKLIRFYTLPSRQAQNRFNERTAAALNEVGAFIKDVQNTDRHLFESELEKALRQANGDGAKCARLLEETCLSLSRRCAALEGENQALCQRVEALEQRLDGGAV